MKKIYAKFNYPNNGLEYDRQIAKEYLLPDIFYEVQLVDMGQSYTSIYLKDFPAIDFNSVFFDFYDEYFHLI